MNKIINLQLLAEPNTQTTTAVDLNPEMKTYYNKELITMAGPHLVHSQFGSKRPIPKGRGKKAEWRKFSNFSKATTPLTEGVTPDGSSMKVTIVDKEVSQYGDYTTISDMLELTAIDDFILQATDKHGENAGLTLDTITRNELNAGLNVFYAPKVVETVNETTGVKTVTETAVTSRADLDENAKLTPDVVAQVAARLKANNAPKINGSYIGIIHPYVAYDLMKSEEWKDAHKYSATKEIFKGEIGEIQGVRFMETSESKILKGDGCPAGLAVFSTLFLGKDAYGDLDIEGGGLEVIVKQKGSGGSSDPLNQRSTVGWKATYASKILIPEYIFRVESCSKFSSTAVAN